MTAAGGGIQFTSPITPLAPPLPPNYGQPPQPTYAQPQSYAPQPQQYAPQQSYAPQPQQYAPQQPMQPQAPAPQQKYQGRDTPTKRLFDRLTKEIAKIYVGQDELVLGTLVAMFSSGHVLIESVPGLGKTLFVRTLGKVLGCQFGRIQFTADLMPSDVTGAPVLDMKTQEFRFRPGPIFTQLLLADEINRAPAKTHAALLEVMQEYRVTVDGKSHPIDRPFLVLATQNPIESEGTYNLPEAQLDRFMFKLVASYPREQEEATILKLHSQQIDVDKRMELELETICSPTQIMEVIRDNAQIRVDEKLVDYINKIVRLSRSWPQFHMGASPRAGIALMQAARTLAAFQGRDYAVPDDVAQIVLPALRHRVMLTAEAEVEGQKVDDLLTELVRSVEVPRI
ncbi:MAG: AAA family ATPase [Pirellulaceae bacterium]